MYERLRNEHSVKWIVVYVRKRGDMETRFFVEWKRGDPVSFALDGYVPSRILRERKPSNGVLDRDFPFRHDAEVYFVDWIDEVSFHRFRQLCLADKQP